MAAGDLTSDQTDFRARLSRLHDAELVSVEVAQKENSVSLSFLSPDRSRLSVKFHGVSHFRTQDLILQNVVSRVLISDSFSFPRERLVHWIKWVTRLSDTNSFADDVQIEQLLSRLLRREALLFVLEPSWGAELAIICTAIRAESDNAQT
jgi:hypothetical protein